MYLIFKTILDHIKIVYCGGNEEYYEYFINWLSRMIQDPEKRPQVALVFYNEEHGTGRNTFTNFTVGNGENRHSFDDWITFYGSRQPVRS